MSNNVVRNTMFQRLLAGGFLVGSLAFAILGIVHAEWYASFSFVLFVTSIIVNLSVYLSAEDYF